MARRRSGRSSGEVTNLLRVIARFHGRIHQASRAPLLRRRIVDKVEQDPHVQGPQQRRRDVTHIGRQALAGERFGKGRDAELAVRTRR